MVTVKESIQLASLFHPNHLLRSLDLLLLFKCLGWMVPESWTTVQSVSARIQQTGSMRALPLNSSSVFNKGKKNNKFIRYSTKNNNYFKPHINKMFCLPKTPTSVYAGGGGYWKTGVFMKMGLSSPSTSSSRGVSGWSRRQSRLMSQ